MPEPERARSCSRPAERQLYLTAESCSAAVRSRPWQGSVERPMETTSALAQLPPAVPLEAASPVSPITWNWMLARLVFRL